MVASKSSFAVSFSALSVLALVSCTTADPLPDSSTAGTEASSSSGSTGEEDDSEGGGADEDDLDSSAADTGGTTSGATTSGTTGAVGTTGTSTSTGGTTFGTGTTGSGTTTTDGAGESDTETNDTSDDPKSKFHIYLALGQSNMQGAAHLPDEPISHPRVRVLQGQNCSEHNMPYGEWRDHFQPVIRCREGERPKPDGSSGPIGLSPVDTFAVTMAEAAGPDVTIGLVGAAYGGTDIQAHLRNCADYGACTPPYGDVSGAPVVGGTTPIYQWILDLARKAQEVGTIKGIIIHHGENNSGDPNWLMYLDQYITALRNDLGLDPSEVPLIAGELPYTGCCSGHNDLVHRVVEIENGHWVSAGPMPDGTPLGDRGDALHWSTFSVIEMGKRYAAKMLEVGNF